MASRSSEQAPLDPSRSRLATSFECWRLPFAGTGPHEQLGERDLQTTAQPGKQVDRRVLFSALKPTHVAPIDLSVRSQTLLRQIATDAESPDIPSNEGRRRHARKGPF